MTSRITLPLIRHAARRAAGEAAGGGSVGAFGGASFLRPVAAAPTTTALVSGDVPRTYSTTHHLSSNTKDDDSHSDFAPQRKTLEEDDDGAAAQAMIHDHVTSNPIMLYMKGTPSMPMCGFSARVVGILQEEGVNFSSVNVLDYPSIREGVKQYAEWPTIPQLYVGGEFVGGCDIVISMAESGELSDLLKEATEAAGEGEK